MNVVVATSRVSRRQRRWRDLFVETASYATKPRQGRHIPFLRPLMPLLRSWNQIGSTFYKYAAPTVLPKLRAATAASEKAVRQNAVTATGRQIDALVYELYGLTAEEIKLVEGGQ